MKFLLDTHALLWWLADDSQLGRQARELVADPGNDVLVSMVSLWEIAVKTRIGNLQADIKEITDAVRQEGSPCSTSACRILRPLQGCRRTIATLSTICSSRRPSLRMQRSFPRTGTQLNIPCER
jgi:hypothetical protein